MGNKIIVIKHFTGEYHLPVEPGKLQEMQQQIDRCLNDEQPAIVVKSANGDQHIYPTDLLKNSYIKIVDEPDNGFSE
ncbi:hypothetical protein SAMN05421856_102229 [Chryseobacterium taichungense]|uniref:Uncharacterized protein n=1 Tax=Chryseobacterium taichungense TaxID=295069 RepID=A0A1H7X606_9FLAO|nr:glyceraldehyde-3-phosphate dehydrogenase [Chryseobacterium taichungense]SEM29153.1 hypothetical protein SAMN05421856_102229 [Chryseobacterium taichungense]